VSKAVAEFVVADIHAIDLPVLLLEKAWVSELR